MRSLRMDCRGPRSSRAYDTIPRHVPSIPRAAPVVGWFVHRTRTSALRKMALSLGWVPKHTAASDAIDRDEDLSRAAMRARMTMVLERAFGELPTEQDQAA